ncbi:MAG: hypothetical protein ACI9G1_001835 [Pirellulaceae bacterium]
MFRNWFIAREGWYYLFVLAFIIGGAVLRDVNLLYILAGMMIGPLLFNWRLSAMMLRGLRVKRTFPDRVFAGETIHVDLEVENSRPWLDSRVVMVRDYIRRISPQSTGNAEVYVDVMFASIPAAMSTRETYKLLVPARGHYQLKRCEISSRYPLGLIHVGNRFDHQDSLTVYPRQGQLTREWLRTIESNNPGVNRSAGQQGPAEGNYYALREWRSGDSKRWVHWRSSAKTGNLVVRQFERERSEGLVLILDLHVGDEPSEADLSNVELAVSFAATAISDLASRGPFPMKVAVAGDRPFQLDGVSSATMMCDCLDHLAVVSAANNNGFEQMYNDLLQRAKPGTRVIVVTTRSSDSETSNSEQAESELGVVATRNSQAALVVRVPDELDGYFHLNDEVNK